jgi:DNA-binding transcriptional regulator YiaG
MKKKYKSEALMVTHQGMKDLFDAGIIDAARMGEFDARCLVPETSIVRAAKSVGAPSVPMKPSRVYASKAD